MDKHSAALLEDNAEMSAEVQMMREALRRLQRQDFKQAKRHEAFLEDTRKTLQQQECELEQLRREGSEMELVLGKLQEGGRLNTLALVQQFDASNAIRHRHQPLVDNVAELEETRLQLENDIAAVKADIYQTTSTTVGGQRALENATSNSKKVARLERKVLQMRGSFSKQLGVNEHLRRHIHELREERSRFVTLRQRLVDKLKSCREEQQRVLNRGTAAFREREFYETKVTDQTISHDVFMKKYEKQRRLRACQIEESEKLLGFMDIKNKTREIFSDSMANKDGVSKSDHADTANSLETDVGLILTRAGLGDLDNLLDNFLKMEVERLSFCTLDVDLANELQRLNVDKQLLIFRCERLSDEEISLTNEQRTIINDLEHQSVTLQHDMDKVTRHLNVVTQDLDEVIDRATHWVALLSCNVRQLSEHQGPDIDVDTLIPCLGLIEKTALEAMNAYSYSHYKRLKGQSPLSKKERRKSKARSMYTLPAPPVVPPNTRSGFNLRTMPSARSVNILAVQPPAWAASHHAVSLIEEQFTPEELRQAFYKTLKAPVFSA